MTDVLKLEFAPLQVWVDFAVAYYEQKKDEQFLSILHEGIKPDAEEAYKDEDHKPARISIYNALAAYHTQKGLKAKDKKVRKEEFAAATDMYNKSTNISLEASMTWVGKGLLLLAKNDIINADQNFDNALAVDSKQTNVPAMLGKACTLFHQAQYRKALDMYKKALTVNPSLPAFLRLGVGLCYFRMADYPMAKQAFERVLELDPKNAQAMSALATLELNSESCQRERAMMMIEQAYHTDPTCPSVLYHLCRHFFYRKDYDSVRKLSNQALSQCQSGELQAEYYFQIARTYHMEGVFLKAYTYYKEALSKDKSHLLARFGYGQMCIGRGDHKEAIKTFEAVYKERPDNFDTLRILGSLYGSSEDQNQRFQARQLLQKAALQAKNNVELLIELGQVCERSHPIEAYQAYRRVVVILEKANSEIPKQIWNNLGVLCHKLDKDEEAMESYNKAFDRTQDPSATLQPDQVTTYYNTGVLYQKMGNIDKAVAIYDDILAAYPDYVDCHMQKGRIHQGKAHNEEALKLFNTAVESATDSQHKITACSLIGNLHLSSGDIGKAEKQFEQILNTMQTDDAYAKINLGNVCHQKALNFKARMKKGKIKKGEKPPGGASFTAASTYYQDILKQNGQNCYAVNGLGVILATWGHMREAKDLFLMAKEAGVDRNFCTNLGHCYVALGQSEQAFKMYQQALERKGTNDAEVLLYLARAHYQANEMQNAKKCLLRAIHQEPTNDLLWYNLALSQEDWAIRVLQKPVTERTSREVALAASELEQAADTFARLCANTTINYLKDKAEKHQDFCRQSRMMAEPHVVHAREREEVAKQVEEESRRQREAVLAAARAADEEKRKREEEERQRLEDIAAKKKAELEGLKDEWLAIREAEEKARENARANDSNDEEEPDLDFEPAKLSRPHLPPCSHPPNIKAFYLCMETCMSSRLCGHTRLGSRRRKRKGRSSRWRIVCLMTIKKKVATGQAGKVLETSVRILLLKLCWKMREIMQVIFCAHHQSVRRILSFH